MENKKMEIIQQLMEQLQDLMGPSTDDFESRLGKKPDVEVLKMGVSADPMGEDPMKDDDSMGKDPMDAGDDASMDDFESPEDKLKSRLLKLRG